MFMLYQQQSICVCVIQGMRLRDTWTDALGAPTHHVKSIIDLFTSMLVKSGLPLNVAEHYIDTMYGHNWHMPAGLKNNLHCCCGMIKFEDGLDFVECVAGLDKLPNVKSDRKLRTFGVCKVMDTFGACQNAIQSSLSATMMVLSTASVIKNTN